MHGIFLLQNGQKSQLIFRLEELWQGNEKLPSSTSDRHKACFSRPLCLHALGPEELVK